MAGTQQSPEKRATLRMVAEAAGVSTATVSYVLSGRAGGSSGVTEETEQRVQRAAEQLHYRPNRAARAVRTGRDGVVLLALHMLSDPWSLAVVDAVNRAANRRGLTTLILADGDWFRTLDERLFDVAYVDGVGNTDTAKVRLKQLVAGGQKLVVFSEDLEPDGFDVIHSDALPGCYLAVEYLLKQHSRIGCLTTQAAAESAEPSRFTPYRELLERDGIGVSDDLVAYYSTNQASAYAAALDLLSRPEPPTAIYATTDFAAISAINAAHRLGLRVPEDVAVIGVGNTPDGQLAEPSLSSVGPVDFFDAQAEVIIGRAVGGSAVSEEQSGLIHRFDWQLFERDSTRLST